MSNTTVLVVHGLAVDVQLTYQHDASAAVVLAAVDSGALQLLGVAHEIEQRTGQRPGSADGLIVEVKLNQNVARSSSFASGRKD